MKKRFWVFIPVLLIIVYFAGPKVDRPALLTDLPQVPGNLNELETRVRITEDNTPLIKPDNEARIIWADKPYRKTNYSLIYIHGWSASQAEGAPIHREIAGRYGMNLFLTRLYGHGLQEEAALSEMTADRFFDSAKEAISIASQLGDSLIIMSTSTGGTLSLFLAPYIKNLAGLILYSPNVEIYDPAATLLDEHWGYEIARMVKGSYVHYWDIEPEREPYWSNRYPLYALTHLQSLVTTTMTPETFHKVHTPVFMGYYYKNDSLQDHTVSIPSMLKMFDELGTAPGKKIKQAFPEAGAHVIGSDLVSRDIDGVRKATFQFLEGILGLVPLDSSVSRSGINQSE